ncbi:MAG: CYTH domain-containing protein [Pseudomonadota bacterium]
MGIEIERKFLVRDSTWQTRGMTGTDMKQGYLKNTPDCTVRVRLAGGQGFITVKGRTTGASRLEFEYPIPAGDAREMLATLCSGPIIEKIRYIIHFRGAEWVVDRFAGDNQGLVLAEIELDFPDQAVDIPDWAGNEVTHDPRYYNASLSLNPYVNWGPG